MKLKQLLARRAALAAEMRNVADKATSEGRGLDDSEKAKYSEIRTQLAGVDAALEIEAELIEAERQKIGAAAAAAASGQANTAVDPNQQQANQQKWASFGEFLGAVARSAITGSMDRRLTQPAASTGANEAIGSDGGFLVNTDFATTLLKNAYNNSVILNGGPGYSGVTRIPLSANSNGININALAEASRADGSRWGGIQAYWLEEGGTFAGSRPKFRQIALKLKKLTGLCYATDELLADATALESVISQGFGEEFAFKLQDALINGTGAGQPLGILNAAATVSQAKESAQTATTINATNIKKMYGRMFARSIPNSVWHINQDCWQQLFSLADAGNNSLYVPPGGLSAAPYGTLMGRPVVPIEQCATLGTVGDILFADWSEYLWCDKGTMESASSMHVQFLTGEMVYRFTFRCDGQPAWNSALTPFKGSNTQSPFISLATRS